MPLPMVHLAIAVQLAQESSQFPSSAFLLGSIAPDAIHMRPNINPDDKQVTHLNHPADTFDHVRIQEMLAEKAGKASPLVVFSAGYAAHILVDRLWIKMIVEPFRARVPGDMDEAARRTLYYQETDQIDCNLYYRMPWRRAVWDGLEQAVAPDFPPWLNADEIDGWRTRTLRWFEDPTHEPHITPHYLTDETVREFINTATSYLKAQFAAWKLDDLVV